MEALLKYIKETNNNGCITLWGSIFSVKTTAEKYLRLLKSNKSYDFLMLEWPSQSQMCQRDKSEVLQTELVGQNTNELNIF